MKVPRRRKAAGLCAMAVGRARGTSLSIHRWRRNRSSSSTRIVRLWHELEKESFDARSAAGTTTAD